MCACKLSDPSFAAAACDPDPQTGSSKASREFCAKGSTLNDVVNDTGGCGYYCLCSTKAPTCCKPEGQTLINGVVSKDASGSVGLTPATPKLVMLSMVAAFFAV